MKRIFYCAALAFMVTTIYAASPLQNADSEELSTQITNVNQGYTDFLNQLYQAWYANTLTKAQGDALVKALDTFKANGFTASSVTNYANSIKATLSGNAAQLFDTFFQALISIEKDGITTTRSKTTWKPDSLKFIDGIKALVTVYAN